MEEAAPLTYWCPFGQWCATEGFDLMTDTMLEGLSEYDVRRPLTYTGTNLLGLIKHLSISEAWYFGDVFGRPFPEHRRADVAGLEMLDGLRAAATAGAAA